MTRPEGGIPDPEFPINEDLVLRLLQTQHPCLAHLPISFLKNGGDNCSYRLGDNYIVRLPRRVVADQLIQNELQYLPDIAQRLPVPTSAACYRGEPCDFYPWHWVITRWLPGQTANLSSPQPSSAKQWANILKVLHLPAPKDGPKNPFRGVPLTQRAESCEERIHRLRDKNAIDFEKVNTIWQTGLDADPTFETRWLHGDMHPLNVLCSDGNIVGLIDWGDICTGDIATDLASFWMLFKDDIAHHSIQHDYGAGPAEILRAKASAVFFAMVLLDSGLGINKEQVGVAQQILNRLGAI